MRGINVQVATPNDLAAAQQQITELLRQRHNIRSGRDDDFTVRNQQEIAETATATSRVMVGHTGVVPAGVKAVETIDACVARLVPAVLSLGGKLLITADHGNCEQIGRAHV